MLTSSESTTLKASKKNFLRSLTSKKPPATWRRKATAEQKKRTINDFLNVQKQLRAEAMGSLPREFRVIFQNQINKFKDEALLLGARTRLANKAQPDETWSDEEIALVIAILVEAARNAFLRDTLLVQMARSKYQSLIDRGYTRARFVLGEGDGLRNPALASRNENLLRTTALINQASFAMAEFRITREILRTNLLNINTSWADAVTAVTKSITERVASNSRLTTIARTDGGRAVDEGIKEAFDKSEIVTHCSVVGCMAIEPRIPTYNGIPTCNIKDVPTEDVDIVEFHINHTGLWIPSKIVQRD